MEVLCTKHPYALPPTAASLDTYPDLPLELIPLEITNYTVTEVVGQLSGVSGPCGKYSVSLQHWLLHFGAVSRDLQLIVSDFPEWLGNRRTPLVANQSMMSVRLIALDKHPGVRPAGVGETWRRLMVNYIRRVTGQ